MKGLLLALFAIGQPGEGSNDLVSLVQKARTWQQHEQLIDRYATSEGLIELSDAYRIVGDSSRQDKAFMIAVVSLERVRWVADSLQLLRLPRSERPKVRFSDSEAVKWLMAQAPSDVASLHARYMLAKWKREWDLADQDIRFVRTEDKIDAQGRVVKDASGRAVKVRIYEQLSDAPLERRLDELARFAQEIAPDSKEALFLKAARIESRDREGVSLLRRAYFRGAEKSLWRFDCLASMALRARRLNDPKLIAEVTALLDKAKRDRPNALLMRISYVEPTLAGTWPPKSR